ncbi:cytokine receptor family member b1 isoform X6 [Ctenopharyngodon idella]|uniref:cytokine receptor family member b1 isoform X6 n=1 Tax=Ctenopharyngodon idella TaxID=7959 RepID=UPI00222E87ED|nr:cytokine receptor family member b1 isoform X6 [Ctenopharyngodon idella]
MTTAYVGHLFLMSLYITVLHTIPAPANFTIVSHNFRHILQWSPGINSPPRTVFNFKQRCCERKPTVQLNIRNTTVDVSELLEDIYTPYTFVVWASLDNTTSSKVRKSIRPYEDTIIGPPVVSLSGCGDCLNITISLPIEGPKITKRILQFYNSVSFSISWKKAGQSEANHISVSSKQHVLQNLQPGDQYCVKVLPLVTPNPNTRSSDWQCEYTSKEEPRGALYLMSWSLGAAVSGLCVLVLALSLFYTGSLCKLKTPFPKSLSNIVQAQYLIPEQTFCERVTSTEAQLISPSKNYPTRNNNPLNVEEGSENQQHEENYVNKADTEDEEDYDEEDEGNYRGCVIGNSGSETNKSKEKAVVSTLPLHNSSGIYHAKKAAMEEIHHDELECKKEFMSEVFEERNRHIEVKSTHLESKGNEDGSGNINLFSVTLRALGPQDDLDEEEVCKPLLPKSVLDLSTSHISVQEEQTEEFLLDAKEMHRQLCVPIQTEMTSDVEEETTSGYMVTHTGSMYEQNRTMSEETDCDTDYITR